MFYWRFFESPRGILGFGVSSAWIFPSRALGCRSVVGTGGRGAAGAWDGHPLGHLDRPPSSTLINPCKKSV